MSNKHAQISGPPNEAVSRNIFNLTRMMYPLLTAAGAMSVVNTRGPGCIVCWWLLASYETQPKAGSVAAGFTTHHSGDPDEKGPR